MNVECKYWKDCGRSDGGCCTENIYINPSFGVCNEICKANTSKSYSEPIEEVKKLPFHKRMFQKVQSYIEAESSLANEGEVDEGVYNHRIETCRACEHLKKSWDEVGHCGTCGCGMGKRAALSVKATMPRATCPEEKWKD